MQDGRFAASQGILEPRPRNPAWYVAQDGDVVDGVRPGREVAGAVESILHPSDELAVLGLVRVEAVQDLHVRG